MKISQSRFVNALPGRGVVNQTQTIVGGNININEPRTMLPSYQKNLPVTTFLRDRYFPGVKTFHTKHVDMDFYKGGQEVAPFVAENSGPVYIKRKGFQTKSYTAPFINIGVPYDTNLIGARLPGEIIYNPLTPEERASILMQQDYNELDARITRREELMAAQCLQTGIVIVKGYADDKGTVVREDTIDFDFDNNITLEGNERWDQTAPDMYGTLKDGVTLIRQAGYNPIDVILGATASKHLLENEDFLKRYMDRRYAQYGVINPQLNINNGNGYCYLGRLTELGVDLWSYLAWYQDPDTGLTTPYVEDNRVIIAPQNIGEFLYGAITQIPEDSDDFVTIEGTRVPKLIVDRKTDTKELSLKSRPVVKPNDSTSWVSIDVIGEAEG